MVAFYLTVTLIFLFFEIFFVLIILQRFVVYDFLTFIYSISTVWVETVACEIVLIALILCR